MTTSSSGGLPAAADANQRLLVDATRDNISFIQTAEPACKLALVLNRLSYDEYFKQVQQTIDQFRRHWREGERVKTLKLVIQLAKVLADSSQLKLYARKYKMIANTLDEFGRMVHERVHEISRLHRRKTEANNDNNNYNRRPYEQTNSLIEDQDENNGQDENEELPISADEALELAKDICRNWFLKVASIRELVPRFYCELAILGACDIFMVSGEAQLFAKSIGRLSKCARGLGDPVVALHARAYLARTSERLCGRPSELLFELLLGNLCDCVQLLRKLDIGRYFARYRQPTGTGCDPELLAGATSNAQAELAPFVTLFELICAPVQSILGQLASSFDNQSGNLLTNAEAPDSGANNKLALALERILHEAQMSLKMDEPLLAAAAATTAVEVELAPKRPKEASQAAVVQVEAVGRANLTVKHERPIEQAEAERERPSSAPLKDADIFAQSVIVHAVCRALPSDLVSARACELLTALERCNGALLSRNNDANTAHNGSPPPPPSSQLTFASCRYKIVSASSGNEPLASVHGVLSLAQCVYAALNSFLVALDASDTLEAATRPSPSIILATCVQINESLFAHENKQLALGDVAKARRANPTTTTNHEQQKKLNENYLRCFKSCVSFAAHYATTAPNLNELLCLFVALMQKQRTYARHFADILDLIKTIFTNRTRASEANEMFGLKCLRQLLEFLRKDEHKLEASRWILETLRTSRHLSSSECSSEARKTSLSKAAEGPKEVAHKSSAVDTRATVEFLVRLFAMLNYSLGPLVSPDERQHLARLVLFHLESVRLGSPHERLEFYAKCRSCLGNLEPALGRITWLVLSELPSEHRAQEKRRVARRNFLNACLAFAFVTIPAVASDSSEVCAGRSSSSTAPTGSVSMRLNLLARLALYIEGARLALGQTSLSLGDFYMRKALATLAELVDDYLLESEQANRRHLVEGEGGRRLCEGGHARKVEAGAEAVVEKAVGQWAQMGAAGRASLACDKRLVEQIESLLNIVVQHQDCIDLRHKLALGSFVKRWTRARKRLVSENDKEKENNAANKACQLDESDSFLQRIALINGCCLGQSEEDDEGDCGAGQMSLYEASTIV